MDGSLVSLMMNHGTAYIGWFDGFGWCVEGFRNVAAVAWAPIE